MDDIQLKVGLEAEDVIQTSKNIQDKLGEIFGAANNNKLPAAFEESVNQLRKLYTEISNTIYKIESFNVESKKVPTAQYSGLQEQLKRLDSQYTQLSEKRRALEQEGKINTLSYVQLGHQLEKVMSNADSAREKMAELREAGKHVELSPEATTQLQELISGLKTADSEALHLVSAIEQTGQGTESASRLSSAFSALSSAIPPVSKILATAGKHALTFIKNLSVRLINAATSALKKLGSALANVAKQTISNGIKKLGPAFLGIGKSAKSSNLDLKKALRTLIKYTFGVRSFFFLYRKVRKAITEGFGNLAIYSNSLNAKISQAVTSFDFLRNSVVAAFAPLINVVAPILSYFTDKLALATAKVGQFFAAITGQQYYTKARKIYHDYAYDLQKSEIEQARKAQEQQAEQARKLEEQQAKQEKKQQESLLKQQKQKEKADKKEEERIKKQLKKYEKQLAGFDDVEILKGPDEDETSSDDDYDYNIPDYSDLTNNSPLSSLGDTDAKLPWEDPTQMFESAKVPDQIKKFADMLKDAWAKADFTDIGRIVGEKLRNALNSIPWDTIKSTLRRIASSIATFLNGFLETPGLFTAIGRTLAQALNSAFEFVNAFATMFHWDSLGFAIRDGILGALNNIDWALIFDTAKKWGAGIGTAIQSALNNPDIWIAIFRTIANGLKFILLQANAFITSIHWSSLGYYIANGMNVGVESFDWELLGTTLVNFLNGAIDFLYSWLTTFDFFKFGYHIGNTISTVLKETDWKQFGATLGAFVNSLFSFFNGLFTGISWGDLATAITDTVSGFFGEFDWETAKDTLSKLGNGLFKVLKALFALIPWSDISHKIVNAIKDYLAKVDWQAKLIGFIKTMVKTIYNLVKLRGDIIATLNDAGKYIMLGVLKGIINIIATIGTWVYNNVVKPVIKAFKDKFGIHSPSKVMQEIGQSIGEGVFAGIGDKVEKIKQKANDIKDKIKGVFNKENWKKLGDDVLDKIKSGIGDNSKIQSITESIKSLGSSIKEKFNETSWDDLGSNIASGIGRGVESKINDLKTTAWNLAVGMYNKACEALGIHSPSKVFRDKVGKMITEGLAVGVEQSAGTALNAVSSLSDALVNSAATDIKIPAIVTGEVVPYSIAKSNRPSTTDTLNKMLEMLQYNQNRQLTKDELMTMLITLFTQYMNIDFYIGDEQIARHANEGNARLQRRYSPVGV